MRLVWQPAGALQAVPSSAGVARTPLGSVWKLFVYSYLVAEGMQEPPYRCEAAQRRSDEEYCCDPGESVDRDTALARSCGPYFAPQRLQLQPAAWRAFWQAQPGAQAAPAWLLDLGALQPATVVEAASLLRALQRVPPPARLAAREALLPNTLRDGAVLAALGSGPRFKTWSWTDGAGRRIGGAAGWLADGTPFWFGAPGTSRTALQAQAGWMAAQWQPQRLLTVAPDAAGLQAQPCVDVALFARYPLAQVQRVDGRATAGGGTRGLADGPLATGDYRVLFANGQSLPVRGSPALRLSGAAEGPPRLSARLPLEDYVARVVDREGDARETEAAKALAIAARSWLLQNTAEQGGCRAVDDDSRAQRVSPNPPSAAAQAAAAFTAGLMLNGGTPVRYHRDQAGPGVMGWQQAVAAARAGQGFEALLRQAYPGAVLGGLQGGADCVALPEATQWLQQRQARWRDRLRSEPGYERPGAELQVCQLQQGVPHADQRRLRIHLREWQSREGRVTLIHEYLHLAFRHHPRGQDEAFVERLAQVLADS
ncbi:DUF2300 domain-containing protein [Aquabacterium sp.]|uniref:DUF2300 domain-containing protein n=1 Tax=Aquabacterium sp. TaxID=1872578 RepID=UPI003783C2AB